LVGSGTWRLESLSKASGRDQVWLIKHEQGHYDIDALLARDFFERVRSMIGQPFSSARSALDQVTVHHNATRGRADALNKLYDDDIYAIENSIDRVEQWNWWCAIERARQLHRSPPERDAEGRLLNVELVNALRLLKLVA
jgi:hypothetical protein